jgi:hypothetical protein
LNEYKNQTIPVHYPATREEASKVDPEEGE